VKGVDITIEKNDDVESTAKELDREK